jgi:hypothetical protein
LMDYWWILVVGIKNGLGLFKILLYLESYCRYFCLFIREHLSINFDYFGIEFRPFNISNKYPLMKMIIKINDWGKHNCWAAPPHFEKLL